MASSRAGEPQRRLTRTHTSVFSGEVLDSEVVPSSLASIASILRVANDVEKERPRVAYLCRFHAFEKAHRLDPTSSGRGVRQFKTALLQRLEKDNDASLKARIKRTDAKEIQSYYQQYYEKYVKAFDSLDQTDRAQLAKAYQTAGVLFEVLCAVNKTEEVSPEIIALGEDVKEKKEIYVPYNILPLDAAGQSQAIMQLMEIRVAVEALRNIRGLPWPAALENQPHKFEVDILDWLQKMFGFQKDNVANQREHLILLLANAHVRECSADFTPETAAKLHDKALHGVMGKLFKNYKHWCKFLGRKSSLVLPDSPQDQQQRKILYMSLYLLIWGEAANLRFMPECLCYIYHNMALELHGMLAGNVSFVTGEYIKPAYGGDDESFLRKVVTPIYEIIEKEANHNKNGTAPHSAWRNYDDFNEYFWSRDCFRLGWPMRADADFFVPPSRTLSKVGSRKRAAQRLKKTGFVEIRSFWHIFRSFDRMWTFYILCLQAMVIISWNGIGSFSELIQPDTLKKISSIFITASALRVLQGILDIVFNLKSYNSMRFTSMLRLLLKLLVSVGWVVLLSVLYVHTWDSPKGLIGTIRSWLGRRWKNPSLYVAAVIVYVLPNILGGLFFLFPAIRRWIENSNWRVIRFLLWWSQPRLYVGRGMHEGQLTLITYTLFWMLLIASKLAFSFFIQIRPLVRPTKDIMNARGIKYTWHEFFPNAKKNIGAVASVWLPVFLIYFMDTQIWYAVYSTLYGGISGAFRRLGEIRTLGMLRSRFRTLPDTFNENLVPDAKTARKNSPFNQTDTQSRESPEGAAKRAKFAQLWNEVITSLREEDLISDKDKALMLVPYSSANDIHVEQWPPFLLASMIPVAIQMAEHVEKKDDRLLLKKMDSYDYMIFAVTECYEAFKHVLYTLIVPDSHEKRVIDAIFEEVDLSISRKEFLRTFKMSELRSLNDKFVTLISVHLLNPQPESREAVSILLQDMYEVVTRDMIEEELWEDIENKLGLSKQATESLDSGPGNSELFDIKAIRYPPPDSHTWVEQIKRLHLLLTVKESAMEVPTNREARRRINFFTNSLFMDMPRAPRVRNMQSFSVLTPYYQEEIVFTERQLYDENEDGVSILFYLEKIFPDEWVNFKQRVGWDSETDTANNELHLLELRKWASFRGQTLSRTVRGMMYYRRALELQAFLDMANDEEILEGYKVVANSPEESKRSQRSLWAQLQAVADMKFTYVVSCQIYGMQKRSGDSRATDILNLMKNYPSLRVAYIDEVEEREKDKIKKVYYSVLVKAVDGLDQEIYRIKLPGPVKLGEGKPENQNHAIIFTRGEALQTIDMNQDNYLEETFKMRNLLEEFRKKHGVRHPTILGIRENIFTGSVSSLAWFMSNQESSFVTIGQRVLANPLKVRFHYGHPDVFDRLFHITRGGISKASRGINLSEDIFAGFNSTLRKGNITHHEYIQVGKGRDVGLNQISLFEAKVANGNGEQTLSRDVYRLGHRFDFFRMMSCYFTTVGFYYSTLLVVFTVYAFLYGRLYLALSGMEQSLIKSADLNNDLPLQVALASQSLVQLGALMALPMVMEIGLERGFRTAFSEFIVMQLQLAPVFFTFSMGTRSHYYGRTILHGGAKYRSTGRFFVVYHEKFAENYRLYSRSHFTKGLELLVLLIVYNVYGTSAKGTVAYLVVTFSMWFLVITWLFAPFLFNPSGFEWQKIVEDWEDWNKWINSKGGLGVSASKSWESWWEEEQEYLDHTTMEGRILEIILSLRFFLYQYGLVYQLHVSGGHKTITIYGLSWLVIVAVLTVLKIVSMGRKRFSGDFQLMFRLLKALLFIGFISIIVILFVVVGLTVGDLFASIVAFMPTGWALLQIGMASKPLVMKLGFWDSIRALARAYEFVMGLLLFAPIAVLAWFPFVSEFQSRLLFNQAFSRGLQISRILAGKKGKRNQEKSSTHQQ